MKRESYSKFLFTLIIIFTQSQSFILSFQLRYHFLQSSSQKSSRIISIFSNRTFHSKIKQHFNNHFLYQLPSTCILSPPPSSPLRLFSLLLPLDLFLLARFAELPLLEPQPKPLFLSHLALVSYPPLPHTLLTIISHCCRLCHSMQGQPKLQVLPFRT
jgi:hypothetical protein